MMITVNLYYTGKNGYARRFAEEMESSGTADKIRAEAGNVRYEYFIPMKDPETVLVGYGLYHETLTLKKIAGIVICLGGLVLINI